MFISNINIGLSTFHKTNIFINDIDSEKQTCFDNTIFVDIHPLYGFKNNYKTVSYIWSHGFYLMNPYHFHSFVNLYTKEIITEEQEISCSLVNESFEDHHHISFFITNNSMVEFTEESLRKVSEDVHYIRKVYPSKTLKYFTYVECESLTELMKEQGVTRVFDFNTLFNCLFVVTNTYSTIFMLAYEFKRSVKIIDNNDENHYLSCFFLNEKDDHHSQDQIVQQRIRYFSAYLKYFTVQSDDDIQYIYNPIIKNFLNIEFKYTRNVAMMKQNTYNNVYIHSDCGMHFQTLINAVSKSSMQLTNRYQDNTLVCIIMSEINLSKRLTKSVTNIIGFDINPCVTLTEDCDTKYYRYYYSSFSRNTQNIVNNQTNNMNDFMFDDKTRVHENGVIFCYLDNSNGLFYTTPKEWSDTWIDILDFLTEKYYNKICIKVHPNDVENKMMMNMVNRYERYGNKVHITQSSLEEMKDNIYFCVINHGSLYFRCMQLGLLLFSPKYNEKKCIYDLHSEENTLNEIVLKYQKERHEQFETVVNKELVNYDDLKCGTFFSLLHSSLSG